MLFPFHYRLYGLILHSTDPLPYLQTSTALTADITLSFTRETVPPHPADSELRLNQTFPDYAAIRGWRSADGIWIAYTSGSDSAHIRIDSRGDIRVALSPALPLENVLPIIYGTAFSLSLSLQGITCLHASAAADHGQAILWVGSTGIGKSTLTAALIERGLQFISDDVAALSESPEFVVQPGCAAARLWVDSANPPRKIWHPLPIVDSGLPIRLIYLVGEAEQPGIVPTAKRDAFLMLAQHLYAQSLQPAESVTRSLDRLRRLIDHVPVRRLSYSRRPADLPAVISLIERDFHAIFETDS